MRRSIALFSALMVIVLLAPLHAAARPAGPAILVDMSHGQGQLGLCTLFAVMPEAYWAVLVPSEDYELPDCPIKPREILVGDFAAIEGRLKDFDMIIIGQPTKPFKSSELEALKGWFAGGSGKVLWCAGDSDYPAQGGNQEIANHACNALLEALGVKIRLDYVSIEDTKSNAGRPYRVVGIVNPDNRYHADMITMGAHKVLFHGPGAVAWVDDAGNWHKLTDGNTPENIIKIVTTTENGRVVEHQPKQVGAPGEFGKAHTVGETGVFVLMGAEIVETGEGLPNIVIVSGETPYGGYQPMITFRYHGVPLDGPRFVRNLLLWSLQYPAELGMTPKVEMPKINVDEIAAKAAEQAKQAVAPMMQEAMKMMEQAKSAVEAVNKLQDIVGDLADNTQKLASTVETLSSTVDSLAKTVDQLSQTVSAMNTMIYIALGLAVIALILAAASLARKK